MCDSTILIDRDGNVRGPRSMAPRVACDRWHHAWPAIDGTVRSPRSMAPCAARNGRHRAWPATDDDEYTLLLILLLVLVPILILVLVLILVVVLVLLLVLLLLTIDNNNDNNNDARSMAPCVARDRWYRAWRAAQTSLCAGFAARSMAPCVARSLFLIAQTSLCAVSLFSGGGNPRRTTRVRTTRKFRIRVLLRLTEGQKRQPEHTTTKHPAPHLGDNCKPGGQTTTPELKKMPAVNDGSHRAIARTETLDPGTNSKTN